MDLMGIIVWLAVLVSLVFFIVAIVKSAKSWGALHTTLLVILFLESWCLVFFTAGVSSRRNGYMKATTTLQKKVDDLDREVNATMFGDRLDPTPDMTRFFPISSELNRLLVERGRVWRNASVQQANAEGATLQLSANRPQVPVPVPAEPAAAAAPAAPAADSGLSAQTIVHAFGEKLDATGSLPAVYLGEYVVTESAPNSVKLKPTAPLADEQKAAINSGSYATWAIYELIPLDDHVAFAADGSKSDENAIWGRMDREVLSKLLGIDLALADAEPSQLDIKQAIKARVLQSYINDGGRPPEGTPPEHLAVRVEFTSDYTIDVDAAEQRMATEGGYYDLEGRSVDARLKRGEAGAKVTFKAGDRLVLEPSEADKLVANNNAKIIAPVYIRPMNDYEYAFREVRRQTVGTRQDIQLIERELAERRKSIQIAENQVRMEQDERAKLDKDIVQYRKEFEVVNAEMERLNEEVKSVRSRLGEMFTQLQTLRDEIATQQRTMTDAINAATAP